jgi:hypothetical protein
MSPEEVREQYATAELQRGRGRPPLKPNEARDSRKKRRETQRNLMRLKRKKQQDLVDVAG